MRTLNPSLIRSSSCFRLLSTTARANASTPFASSPAPPRLPKEDQELYERLQNSSTGAFSTPKPSVVVNPTSTSTSASRSTSASTSDSAFASLPPWPSSPLQRQRPQINQSPHSTPSEAAEGQFKTQERATEEIDKRVRVQASGEGEELHPDVRRGTKPEFEGERNPKTGEVGGPKNEPLRWGGGVDWSYNGRVTDF